MKNTLLAACLLPVLAACAASPDKIRPADMRGSFAGHTCTDMVNTLDAERHRLQGLEEKQRNARTRDTVMLVALGVTPSMFGRQTEADIAVAKGRVIELESSLATRCN